MGNIIANAAWQVRGLGGLGTDRAQFEKKNKNGKKSARSEGRGCGKKAEEETSFLIKSVPEDTR